MCEHIKIIFCFGNWAPLDYFSVVMVLLTIKVNTVSGCSRCLFSKLSVNPAPSTTVEVEQMVFNTVQMPCFYFLNTFFLFVLEQTRSTMQHTLEDIILHCRKNNSSILESVFTYLYLLHS